MSSTSVSVTGVDTGANVVGFDVYEFQADLTPTPLAAATRYWFSALADTSLDGDDDWFWTSGASGDASAVQFGQDPWDSTTLGPFYFILDGTPLLSGVVPEPASILLWSLGVGLVGLGFCRRSRKVADRPSIRT